MKKDRAHSEIQEMMAAFDTQLSRCQSLLYFVAYRVLDSREDAEEAVQNCVLAATRNPRKFKSEGAFRRWLVRTLIDEALQVLHQKESTSTLAPEPVFAEER